MDSVVSFVSNHWTDICATIVAVVAVAHAVVKLTPSTKDDEIVAKVEEVIVKYLPQPKQ